jgi:uroporphyrinogen decarboxylase
MSHKLLDMITNVTIRYLKLQIAAGADIVQIFDSWSGILSPTEYSEFGMKYVSRICDAINEVPVTVFAKGAYYAREDLARLNCQTIGIDWNMDIAESRRLIGDDKTLQGNLDPCILFADFATIESKTKNMLNSFGNQRHIANLGHGVYPDTDPEKVKCFIETVKGFAKN